MKADEIQDILELQALLADQGHNEAAEDPETLAGLITWKYGGNGVMVTPPPAKSKASPNLTDPPKRGRPAKASAPAAKAVASAEEPDF